MTIYSVALRMAFGGADLPDAYKWSYKFYADVANVAGAIIVGQNVWNTALKATHGFGTYAYQVYATDLAPGTTDYEVYDFPTGLQRGTLGGPDGRTDMYNPAVCARMDLRVAGGRPSRKFLRIGIQEQWMGDGGRQITNPTVIGLLNAAGDDLMDVENLCDESGNAFSAGAYFGVTTRKLGKMARFAVPTPPPFG